MSSPSLPPDNSAQIEAQRIAAEERRRAEEAAAAERRKQELAQLRSQAATSARASAGDYFSGRGLDPTDYYSSIDAKINAILSGVGPEDPNPGAYFTDIGPLAWTSAEEAARNKAMRQIDPLFAPNFEVERIPFTLDDPYLTSIENEQYSSADQIIRNMLDRGVITPTGYQAARRDLEGQRPGVRSRLNEIGTGVLTGGQQSLRDIANEARQTASTLNLGTAFDPYSYSGRADRTFNEFVASLGDTIRGRAPGDLFSTAGLAAIAGAGQGGQNTIFDPAALAGAGSTKKEEEDEKAKEGVF